MRTLEGQPEWLWIESACLALNQNVASACCAMNQRNNKDVGIINHAFTYVQLCVNHHSTTSQLFVMYCSFLQLVHVQLCAAFGYGLQRPGYIGNTWLSQLLVGGGIAHGRVIAYCV